MVAKDRFRYIILLVGLLCLTSISSNMFAFNIAEICMDTAHVNATGSSSWSRPVDFSSADIYLLNGAVGVGTFVATWPFSEAYIRLGARWPFFAAGILSATATALTPVAAMFDFWALMALRFLQGVAYAADFAAVGSLCSSWASLKQHGMFLGVLTSYSPLSASLTFFFGGHLCNTRLGWSSIFYVHAVISFVVFGLWFFFYTDRPQRTKRVTPVELEKIQRGKTAAQIEGGHKVPYWRIFTDLCVWSIWMSAFAEIFSTHFIAQNGPYFLQKAMGFSESAAGTCAALMRFIQIPVRLLCGELSDRMLFISESRKLNLFNTICVAGAAVAFFGSAFVPKSVPILAVITLGAVNAVTGAASGGFYKCATLYARQYSHFVIASCQFLKCAALLLSPALTKIFASDPSELGGWRIIFLGTAVALCLAAVLFIKFSSAEAARFTTELEPEDKSSVQSIESANSDNFHDIGKEPQRIVSVAKAQIK